MNQENLSVILWSAVLLVLVLYFIKRSRRKKKAD